MTIIGNKFVVADRENHRVLIYNEVPDKTDPDPPADVVIGQNDMTSGECNKGGETPTASTLCWVAGVTSYGEKLIIADRSNNRILIYNSSPTTNGSPADVVVGQTDFTSNECNPNGVNDHHICAPYRAVYNGEKFAIGDHANHRVLIYNELPTQNGASADVVVGQPDFNSNQPNQEQPNPAANTFRYVKSIFMDKNRLYVTDEFNHRLLIFHEIPTENNVSADVVLGQPDFNTGDIQPDSKYSLYNQTYSVYAYENKVLVSVEWSRKVFIYHFGPKNIVTNVNKIENKKHRLDVFAENAEEMTISNTKEFSNTEWIPYASSYDLNDINPGEDNKMYVKFRDAAGFESEPIELALEIEQQPIVINNEDSTSNQEEVPNQETPPGDSSSPQSNPVVQNQVNPEVVVPQVNQEEVDFEPLAQELEEIRESMEEILDNNTKERTATLSEEDKQKLENVENQQKEFKDKQQDMTEQIKIIGGVVLAILGIQIFFLFLFFLFYMILQD